MKIEKQLLRILLIFISIVAIYNIKSYCVVTGTWRMEIKKIEEEQAGVAPWTNITVSNAYKECESLNSATSTLGTNNLRAHLTTDADWSAMAIFSISQYGGATSNSPESTTGNESGVYNIGKKYTFTTGILENAAKEDKIKGLYNDDGSLKEYMKSWSLTREDNNFVGFIDKAKGGTWGWFGSSNYWGTWDRAPVSAKTGLFGTGIGAGNNFGAATWGDSRSNVTFRPVIWN